MPERPNASGHPRVGVLERVGEVGWGKTGTMATDAVRLPTATPASKVVVVSRAAALTLGPAV